MKVLKAITLLVFICSPGVQAQQFSINLSQKHLKKLETYKSGHKRLVRYYKFYKRDSTHEAKKLRNHYKRILDSAYRVDLRQERLRKRLSRKGIALPEKEMTEIDRLDKLIRQYWVIANDSISSDSLKNQANEMIRSLAIEKAKLYPGFQNLLDNRYVDNADSINWEKLGEQIPGFDTLSVMFGSSPEQLFALAEKMAETSAIKYAGLGSINNEMQSIQQLKELSDQYVKDYEKYTDVGKIKAEGKERAIDKALDYFANHASELEKAQEKIGKLMSKYRVFTGGDLKNAVKHTSMKGKTFKEHLSIGGNFSIVSTQPVSLDLAPQIGYLINSRFSVGLGASFRCTFGDSIKNARYISPGHVTYKAFISYDVIKSFFAVAEWEKSRINETSNDLSDKVWKDNFLIGIGKKFLIHPKLYFLVTGMYNLTSDDKNPIEPTRFKIRLGFQISELALRQKKSYFDPNR